MNDQYVLTFIEIDIPVCVLTYGVAPCTAALGVTGEIKCFNCFSTCQDPDNYDEDTVTLRFAIGSDFLAESGIDAIAILEKVDFSPAIISLGEDLGQRASLTAVFGDIPWSDTGPGFDPYVAERAYNPFEQGSFWGKFRARQPYLRGRSLRWITGTLGQTLEEMETRHFVIESTDGPADDGEFRVIAKDLLKLADGDRAQAPAVSQGYLSAGITSSATTATLAPAGIGATYPASGLLAIGNKEVVSFTRSSDTLTITRAQQNTVAVAHSAQDEVQVVLQYTSQRPSAIIYDLLVNYAGVPASAIDLTAWETEAAAFNSRLYSTVIAVPTAVNKLVSELVQQAGLVIWWDDIAQAVRFQVLRQIATDSEAFSDDNIMDEAFQIEEQPNRRISEVWTHYSQINPLAGQDDPENYRSKEVLIDLDASARFGSRAIKKIYSRWIPAGGRSAAARINDILFGRFRDPPRRFTFSVFRYGAASPTLGEGCLLETFSIQDATGALASTPAQIIRLNSDEAKYTVVADEMRFVASNEDPNRRDLIYDAPINGLNLYESHNLQYVTPVGGETVNAYIEQSAVIGTLGYGQPALDIDTDWPTVSLTQGNRTLGSAIITGLADTSIMKIGMPIRGNGMPSHARILTIDSASQVTLDQNATSTGSFTVGTPGTLYTVIINLYVRGRLQGAGGNGGQGSYFLQGPNIRTTAAGGSSGSLALYVRYPINLILNEGLGRIWGGGGGGGGAGVLALSNHAGGSGGGGAGIPGGTGGPPTQSANSPWTGWGGTGGQDAGGGGAGSYASFSWAQSPYWTGVTGGNGGAPGVGGGSGGHHGGNGAEQQVGGGGSAGPSIDGVSYCKKTGTGDLRGSEIN